MGTILGAEIIGRAALELQDTNFVRWSVAEHLLALEDGQRQIVLRKPDAYSKNVNLILTVSATRQTLPSDGIMLLDIVKNMGTDGETPGKAITRTEKAIMDSQYPDWHIAAASSVVRHFMYDERDPVHFYVYPPQPATDPGYIEIIYSASPPPLIASWRPETVYAEGDYCVPNIPNEHLYLIDAGDGGTSAAAEPSWPTGSGATVSDGTCTWTEVDFVVQQQISIPDVYMPQLIDYVLYKAYAKDADTSPYAAQKSQFHLQAFLTALGSQEQAENIYNRETPGG